MADRISGRSETNQLSPPGDGAPLKQLQLTQRTRVVTRPLRAGTPAPEPSTIHLVETALKETRELVRLEFALARLEAKVQLKAAVKAAISFGVASALAIVALCVLAVAIVLALGATPVAALLVCLAILILGGIAVAIGYAMLPKHPLERTRHHLEDDFKQLKEHVA